jgi:hypothetical protein
MLVGIAFVKLMWNVCGHFLVGNDRARIELSLVLLRVIKSVSVG